MEQKIYNLPELLTRNREVLDEVNHSHLFILYCACILRSTPVHSVGTCNLNSSFCLQTQRMLDEEERDDSAMKDRFKQKWGRTESGKLTESLRAEVAKFQGIVETATKV